MRWLPCRRVAGDPRRGRSRCPCSPSRCRILLHHGSSTWDLSGAHEVSPALGVQRRFSSAFTRLVLSCSKPFLSLPGYLKWFPTIHLLLFRSSAHDRRFSAGVLAEARTQSQPPASQNSGEQLQLARQETIQSRDRRVRIQAYRAHALLSTGCCVKQLSLLKG